MHAREYNARLDIRSKVYLTRHAGHPELAVDPTASLHQRNDDSAIFNLAGAIIRWLAPLLLFQCSTVSFYLYFGDNNRPRGSRYVKEINHGMPANIYAVSKEKHRAGGWGLLSIF